MDETIANVLFITHVYFINIIFEHYSIISSYFILISFISYSRKMNFDFVFRDSSCFDLASKTLISYKL